MKTQYKITIMIFGVLLLSTAVFLSCVDVPTNGPEPMAAKAAYRFIHAATDIEGEVTLAVDGANQGNLSFRGVIPHKEYTAGTRQVVLSNGDTVLVSMATDYRGTFCLLDKALGERTVLRLTERRTFDSPNMGNSGALRFVNLSPDSPAISFEVFGPDTLDWNAVAYGVQSPYKGLVTGEYSIVGKAGDTTVLDNWPVTMSNTRTTVCVVGKAGALDLLVLADN